MDIGKSCLTGVLVALAVVGCREVPPTGADVLRVTPEQGMAGLEAARDAARGCVKPVTVSLAPGVYRLTHAFTLGAADSGVNYVAEGRVELTGARPIKDWRVEADGTWSAPVAWVKPDRTGGFRRLRVNGEMRPRARLPKTGGFTVVGDEMPKGTRYNVSRKSFLYDPREFHADWKNLSDAEIICYHFWTDTHLRIARIEPGTNRVTFVSPSRKAFNTGFSNNTAGGTAGGYVIENIPAAMTQPGEWWLDYGAKRLHYFPKPGETPETIRAEVPVVERLVTMDGTRETGFTGVVFSLSQYELPARDVNNQQAAAGVTAAVSLKNAYRCAFRDCRFEDLSGYAIDLGEGCRETVISRCALTRLGAGGVRLNGGTAGASPLAVNSGSEISDCEIGPYGQDFRSAVGVLLMNAEKARICYNHIFDGWYTGISVGWVWGYYPSVSRWNEISHNHIHKIGQGCLSDMGGIYMLGPAVGTRVTHNRIHDVDASHYGGWGIYNDEGSTGILVENNVVYDTKFAGYDIHYAKDITVRNNIFALGRMDQLARTCAEKHVSCELENNIVYWTEGRLFSGRWQDAAQPFPVHRRGNDGRETPSRETFRANRNVYFNPNLKLDRVEFGNGKTWNQWHQMGKDRDSLYGDPFFADVAKRDFNLRPGSPALKLGFMPFDQSDVGPRTR